VNVPTIIPHLQKRFKLVLHDGQPEGLVEEASGGNMMLCCPLCECSHQVIVTNPKKPYSPLCQEMPLMFKVQRTEWLKLFPEVTSFKTLHLVRATV